MESLFQIYQSILDESTDNLFDRFPDFCDAKSLFFAKENSLNEYGGGTYHFMVQRADRSNRIANELPKGKKVAINILDRGHPNGPEAYVLYDNGVIQVYNARTMRHITDLIARPQQIKQRMGKEFDKLPEETKNKILDIAKKNTELGRNNW